MPGPPIDDVPEQVNVLIAYDEQLRQGAAGSTRAGSGSQTPAGAIAAPAELVECLQLIEEVWPRGGQRPPPAASLPTHIGRFEIERLLGSGGFGIVYLARDPLLQRQVALKVPRLHVLATDGMHERFQREARMTAALDHPHIVPIHETGEVGPLCYIAFAYCEGPSLAQWLKLQAGDVPPRVAALIVRQLAEAMHYSHSRGVLHRDLKPSNVLLFPSRGPSESGEALPFVPRIVDFGLARLVEDELEATGTSAVIGTPLYMAPEQALGKSDAIGPAADLYALGVMLYELLCRRPPFVGTAPLEVLDQVRHADPPGIRQARPEVARDLETICLKCLQKRPEDRYATAQTLAQDLERFLSGEPIAARPVSALARLHRWCQRPERIREAGLTIIGIQLAVIGSMLLTVYMASTGLLPRPEGWQGINPLVSALGIMLTTHVPLVFVGRAVIARRAWAAWLSLASGVGMTIMAALMAGVIPNFLWGDIPGFRAIYPLMMMLFLLQTLVSVMALIALRQRSH